jgi:N-acetylglucosaminyldiphosphoundecaprenol N-acetyl-beta-D-mannosaminyltransferase
MSSPAPAKEGISRVTVAGLPVVRLTRTGFAEQMVRDWQAQQAAGRSLLPKTAFSVNGQGIALYYTDSANRAAMDAADYIHADGMPVVFASKLLTRTPLPERVATTDFFHDAAKAAVKAGMKFYFFGGPEDHNKRMADAAKALYPDLIICGRHHDRYKPEEEAAIVQDILATGTDVLWLSLGKPKQEEFCQRYREQLRGVTWFKTCGGLFKFVIGHDTRAPEWMQKLGLEWLYRMLREPRRLGWRYITTNMLALWYLITKTRG